MRLNLRLGGVRIGVIVPSLNVTVEPELYALAPPGCSFHSARVPLPMGTPENLVAMNAKVEEAASLLVHVRPSAVLYACTAGSFIGGLGSDRAIGERIAAIVGCPAVTTSCAMIEAFRYLGLSRIALATPYLDAVTQVEAAFFEANGIAVVRWGGLQLMGEPIRKLSPQQVAQLAREVDSPEAQAIFVSCTQVRALEVIEDLENELGKPVLSSNQVSLWAVLRLAGFEGPIGGHGRLLAVPTASVPMLIKE